jgi:NitT/TauT family transport system ATP-binding protein
MEVSPFLTLADVGYTFSDDGTEVLTDINLTIRQGAFVALVGASGIGKSTLLRIIGGLIPATRGQVLHDGTSPKRAAAPVGIVFQKDNLMPWRTAFENVRLPVGIVFQKDNLMPWRTAFENVRLPLELRPSPNTDSAAVAQRVREMLELVGLSEAENNYPSQLSGGMAQRVAIARALVHEPELLLLDEPFGSLDALTRERMGQELLRIWRAMPVTVFMVTHSIDEAVFLADDVLVMGSASDNGLPATIKHQFPIRLPRPRRFEMRQMAAFAEHEMTIRQAIQAPQ